MGDISGNISAMDNTRNLTSRPLLPLLVKPWYPWIIAFMYPLSFFGVCGNVLTILTFKKNPILRKVSNFLVCNLSVANLWACILVQSYLVVNYIKKGIITSLMSKSTCLFTLWGINLSLHCGLFSILALSVERFLCVFYPGKHQKMVNKRSMKVFILTLWICIFVLSMPPALGWNHWHRGVPCRSLLVLPLPYMLLAFYIPVTFSLVSIFIINISIFYAASKQRRRIQPQEISIAVIGAQNHKRKKRSEFHRKKLKVLFMVVIVFFVTWTPLLTTLVTASVCYAMHIRVPAWLPLMADVARVLMILAPVCNPLIYAFNSRLFRQTLGSLLFCRPNRPGLMARF